MNKYKRNENKYKSVLSITEFLFDEDVPINERMFLLAMSLSILATICMAILGLFTTSDNYSVSIYLVITSIIMVLFTYLGVKYRKVDICTKIFVALIILVFFPSIYYTGGANTGGIIAWNLFGLAFILVLLSGKTRIVYFIGDLIIIALTYIGSYLYPNLVTPFEKTKYALIDSYASFILVGLFISSLILYQNKLFKIQRDKAMAQVKEIEALNIAQNNFFSNMSHEIRTPINTIIGLNEMTLRDNDASDEAIENAMNIESASKMLLSLINDILDISKIQSGNMDILPVQYDTTTLFSDVVNMIYIQAKNKDLNFKVVIDPEFPSILLCDEVRLRQILINLLNNAVKYTKEGSVTLSVRGEFIENKKIRTTFSISDTGIGIRKENIPYLFDSFKRVDENNNRFIEGTGLGLAICKQLSELLGGKLSVDSVYTKGSTFHFTLDQVVIDQSPIGDIDFIVKHANMKTKKYHQSFEAPSARVLIVDDNELNRTVASKLLRDTRVITDTAPDGMTALELTRTNYYHIILMDHMMPVMDGIECAYQIRNQIGGLSNESKILALTANVKSNSNEFYKNAGFDGYLSKPISGAMLEAAMVKYLPSELISYIDIQSESINSSILDSDKQYKNKCRISTNSTCDLGLDLCDEYNISIIPYSIETSHGQFRDGVEIDGTQLSDYIYRTNDTVTAIAPSVEDYEDYFSNLLNECDEIIHLCTANELSPDGLENAYKAAASFGSIHIINTGQLSGGLGMLAMFASILISQGVSTADTIEMINKYIYLTETNLMMANGESFVKNDYLNSKFRNFANAFMIRPVIITRNGKLDMKFKYFGRYNINIKRLIKNVLKNNPNIDERFLLITYNGLSVDEIEELKKEIGKYKNFGMINVLKCSAVNYTMVNKNAFGFFYFLKP